MSQLLAKGQYLLKKFPGKGGWTYTEIPQILPDKNNPFGWVRVKGSIDSYQIEKYHMMPLGNGKLFLPVKAEIRKKIRKQEGDYITVELFRDDSVLEIPKELKECLETEPKAHQYFFSLKESQQKEFIDWIYSAKKSETQDERIVKTIELLLRRKHLRVKGQHQ